jgi:tRNA pseudouridine55 synthase
MPKANSARADVSGILLLDKPAGVSSNHVLQRAKRLLGADKAGHAGTLDPFATGALPLAFGEATKACTFMLSQRKAYRATAAFGTQTDTGDLTGEAIAQATVPALNEADVRAVLQRFMGRQMQTPPRYAALKKDGVPQYELARRGIEFECVAREISIESIALMAMTDTELVLDVVCGKGTYIRALVEDIARALGTLAHTRALHRHWVEPFVDADWINLAALESYDASARHALLLPVDAGLCEMPISRLDAASAARFLQGQRLALGLPEGLWRVYQAQELLGIGQSDARGVMHIQRLLKKVT